MLAIDSHSLSHRGASNMARGIFTFGLGRGSASSSSVPRRPRPLRPTCEVLGDRQLLAAFLEVGNEDPGCALPRDRLFCEVQDAIDAAAPGSRIKVDSGVFLPFLVNKPNLRITGEE